ncbi:purine-binding chemotaxis protein CheW [Novosphingobium sp. PhB165]|uniref:chemotaxis protein CheW n=1 Tax=Novosphingobium sp. PhB165 TaxID=2485105 RepID=UPI00104E2809|nr:chemotaxis protein CheW [Novosphingobium sp. PhB165]TCM21347.1 purine-binding chemotaxis protein CheW [Novosphingobium sp. PhB165]
MSELSNRELLVVVTLAGRRIALRSRDVQSVISLEVMTPVPCAPPHVAGLSGLRSRVLTVIDGCRALDLGECSRGAPGGAGSPAAVVMHEGHAYALLLDEIEDVTEAWNEPQPINAQMEGNWAAMSHGLVETALGPLLVADVGALIAGPQATLPPSVEAA